MDKKRGILLVVCTLAFSAALCLAIYEFDNKYTSKGSQPINGVLFLSQNDLAQAPVRYLTREWEFYPGILLTPEETSGAFRRYVDIGRTDYFKHGSGTYRLHIVLPPEEASYALELPEIFSAYRLYINGREYFSLGVPEEDSYREAIGSQVITFSASDSIELLIAVSDYSGHYSGLVYPPAFGEAGAVATVRERRLLLHGGVVLMALFGLLFSLGFAFKSDRTRGILMGLCCLCFMVVAGYPLYHGVLVTSYIPWYSVELACLYGLWLMAVLLFSHLYGLSRRRRLIIAVPCLLGVGAAILRGIALPFWNETATAAFSAFSSGLKCYVAFCLIALSVWAFKRGLKYAGLLFCGALSLSVCLVCDRLLPLYEPIYGGWFYEIGGTILVATLALVCWQDALSAYRFRCSFKESYSQMERQLSLQKEHYRQMSEQIERSRESAHNLRHHSGVLRELAERGENNEILRYLDAYEPHLLESEVSTFSSHLAADAILCHYQRSAKLLGVEYNVQLSLPQELPFPADELCVILGNLLENALEALQRQADGLRTLYLRGSIVDDNLALMVKNSFSGQTRKQQEHFLSSKREGFGLGIRSVERIVSSHSGLCNFVAEGQLFTASILIPLQSSLIPYDENITAVI